MRSRQQLINLRIIHIVIMLATGLFAYQFTQWEDALWIPISVAAIVGPFYPGLSIHKASQRVVGSIAGLLLSVVIWFIIHYNYNLLLIIAILLIYCIAFSTLQDYTYLIFFISIMLCINFDYLNLFVNNEIVYLVNRIICVLTGVSICLFYEFLIFKHYYKNATPLIETARLDQLIEGSLQEINQISKTEGTICRLKVLNLILKDINKELKSLEQLKTSCAHNFSNQDETIKVIELYLIKLNNTFNQISKMGFKNLTSNFVEKSASKPI